MEEDAGFQLLFISHASLILSIFEETSQLEITRVQIWRTCRCCSYCNCDYLWNGRLSHKSSSSTCDTQSSGGDWGQKWRGQNLQTPESTSEYRG
ncbi:hypothetical protein AVEN_225711-1 [Araneus ventricosus]|uniref:Uncharacterized protein n=1 Tax=Araneus ventricosus TaxID=182803 RepID=A0A4Y2QUA7_ARAVE|nr:hypothetical protein AVEN_70943-1 [Araneus ventricosus]GBN66826.1 hypothetical protein AVEN_225711-1 [Araneus ventricosus]